MIEGTILLVGCGSMGGALLRGWFARGLNPVDIMIVEPAGRQMVAATAEHPALVVLSGANKIPTDFTPDVVVFAVKPQVAHDVIPLYAPMAESGTVFLSIIAGLPIKKMQSLLGYNAAIVRAMPNTPASIGQGISVLCPGTKVGSAERRVCQVLMAAAGQTAWIEDESDMDAVTALSGSGPAYIFLLTETLTIAGVRAGLSPALAGQLASATVSGAGALLAHSDKSPTELREIVASPGGTTAAALDVLMHDQGMQDLMNRTIDAAARRSKELAG